MKPSQRSPVLFFDFDNTITQEDVLDRIIEKFSISDEWRDWEAAWARREISTAQCLARQIAGIRASEADLLRFVASFQLDPHFATIAQWAAREHVDLLIVSDNFSCIVREILSRHGFADIPVFANELTFSGNRPTAHFPFRSTVCARCAHCKAEHFKRFPERSKIFVGDGLSDICPALAADIVFAKDSLAAYLVARGTPFTEFGSLDGVADVLMANALSVRGRRAVRTRVRPQIEIEGLPGES